MAERGVRVAGRGSRARGAEPDGPPVSELLPDRLSLGAVRDAAKGCHACHLYTRGTQTVFGDGPSKAEVMMVGEQPGDAVVCLGATAAQALLGRAFRVSVQRGTFVPSPLASRVTATVHPSSILRASDDEMRRAEMERFVADLAAVAHELSRKEP